MKYCPNCGHLNHQSKIHKDICTVLQEETGAECGCNYPQGPFVGELRLGEMKGEEISPGIILLEEPHPVEGTNRLRALANVNGMLAVVEMVVKLKEWKGRKDELSSNPE